MRSSLTIVAIMLGTFVGLPSAYADEPTSDSPDAPPESPPPAEALAPSEPPTSVPPTPEVTPPPPSRPRVIPAFGTRGGFVVNTAATTGIVWSMVDDERGRSFDVTFSPGVDYFVLKNFSLGLNVDISYSNERFLSNRSKTTSIAAGPRVGFNMPLSRRISFYPRLTVAPSWLRREEEDTSVGFGVNARMETKTVATQTGVWLSLHAPILFHPTPHAFFGIGPTIFRQFGRKEGSSDMADERTSFGGGVSAGIHWGGRTEQTSSASDEAQTVQDDAKRYGDAETYLFDISGGASGTWYDGGAWRTSFGAGVGVDYFVAPHLSLGAGVGTRYSNSLGYEADGVQRTAKETSVFAYPRVGGDLPLVEGVSLYTRLGVSFGNVHVQRQTGKDAFVGDIFNVTFIAETYFVFHVASHALIGFGPFITRDAQRGSRTTEVAGTVVGAGSIIGLWF